jgi:(p)ppGpp synthase/HD superfamily hydrolase
VSIKPNFSLEQNKTLKIMNNKTATLEDAIAIAAEAHKGQMDKAGAPYILHPLRMMMQMNTEAEMITAILHDVVEDSSWTIERLRDEGFSEEVLEAVECVTNRSGESYEQFIERAGKNPIARQVKIVDLKDNMNIQRIGEIKPKDLKRLAKYHKSWSFLTK